MKRKPNATLSKITSVVSRLLLVIVAAVTLTATNLIQSYFSREGIRREASLRAASELDWAKSEIMNILNQAETAVNNNMRTARWCLSNQDSIWRIPRRLVKDNPILVGAALALVPGYSKDYPLCAPYSYRDLNTGEVKNSSLATEEYDYPSWEWFTMPIEQDGPYWSEPYFDEGGGEMLMVTYSVPVKDYTGHAAAVLTADISLSWLSSVVDSIETYNRAVSKITSRLGKEIVSTGGPLEPGEKCQTYSYMSLHYVCRIPGLPYKAEVQMRTLLQHAWANLNHDTGYKSGVEVPKEYIRSLNRLAGLLELADEEFGRIRSELADYRRRVQALVASGNLDDVPLDGETFRSYLNVGPFDRLNKRIASINQAEIQEVPLMPFLQVFKGLRCNTLGDVARLVKEYSEHAYQIACYQMGLTDLDIISSSIGPQNLCIAILLKNGAGKHGLRYLFDALNGESEGNDMLADMIIEQAKDLPFMNQ